VFIEPVFRRGSYTDLARLVEDEREVQKLAATGEGRRPDVSIGR
jgi:hypothetical protein